MKTVLAILVAIFLIGACSNAAYSGGSKSVGIEPAADNSGDSAGEASNSASDCISAAGHSNQALKDLNAGDYSGGYKNATTAVKLSDSCDSTDMPFVKGFALSFKALNEHHLSVGDSETDMNQAEQLLADCQTQPGYYGTHAGALCDTQEDNDIQEKTNWEMANY